MKNLLLFASLLASVSASAQTFEIGISSGPALNKIVKTKTESDLVIAKGQRSLLNTPSASIKAMVVSHCWKYGVTVGYSRFSYSASLKPGVIICYSGAIPVETIRKYEEQTYGEKSLSYVPVKMSVNRNSKLGKHTELYYGAQFGYIFITGTQTPQTASFSLRNPKNSGHLAGLQVGATYAVSKHLGINVELGGDYMKMTSGQSDFTVITLPITVGACYKF